jgi:hypothetical protein
LTGSDLAPGDFVEFRAVLSRSPFVDLLQAMKRFAALAPQFEDSPPPRVSRSGGGKPRGNAVSGNQYQKVLSQIDALLSDMTSSGSIDLIGTLGGSDHTRAVVAADISGFADPSLNEVIDGEFSVFGKVARVVMADSASSINLLRKGALGLLPDESIDAAVSGLGQAVASSLNLPTVETRISGPSFQVIPICIFA